MMWVGGESKVEVTGIPSHKFTQSALTVVRVMSFRRMYEKRRKIDRITIHAAVRTVLV